MSYPVYYVVEGDTLPILFDTFDGGTGASITMTGLAVTDIEIYKDGSVTQRASDAGYVLLDTDGIDFDGITGIHGFSIDLSDNTTAGFFEVGPWYHVVVSTITVDGQTVSFIAAAFRIVSATRGLAGTALPAAVADAAGGLPISDAGGLDLDAKIGALTFTIANKVDANATHISGDSGAADNAEAFFDGTGYAGTNNVIPTVTNLTNLPTIPNNWLTAAGINADAFTAAKFADDCFVAANFAADVTTEFQSGLATAAELAKVPKSDGTVTWNATALASINAEADTALSDAGVTFARMGYVDNLNIGGNVASSAEVTAIQNNTRVVRVVPEDIELPTSGTRTYRIELLLYDSTGNMEAPDSAPTIALVNQAGTDRSGRLDSTTMSLVSTGRYRAIYTSTAGDTKEQLVWAFSVVEGGQTRIYGNTSYITDAVATDFTSADRAKLDTLHDDRLTAARAGYLDNINNANLANVPAFPSNFATLSINASGHVSRVTLVDTVTTLTGHTAQTGDAYARLGAPAGASVSADIAAVKAETATIVTDTNELQVDWTDGGRLDLILDARASQTSVDTVDAVVDAIKAKTDNLPASPAATGDAMTLTSAALDAILVESGISAGSGLINDTGTQLTSINARQALSLMLSALAAKLAGAGTANVTLKPAGKPSGNTRIDATVDGSNNRTAVTLKVPD